LQTVSDLLGVNHKVIPALLERAEHARNQRLSVGLTALPVDWAHGEPQRVGDKVVFTGCDEALRVRLGEKSELLGVRVISAVSAKTAVLVSDGTMDGGKAAKARDLGTRTEHPMVYATLLEHLQAALARDTRSVPEIAAPQAHRPSAADLHPDSMMSAEAHTVRLGASPAEVRTWVRANGYEVGVRGRLHQDVLSAYAAAHSTADAG
jgi:DNA polymerase-3 subunit epsilon